MKPASEEDFHVIIQALATELNDVRALLLEYECAMTIPQEQIANSRSPTSAQGFDLAMQILADLQRIALHLRDHAPTDIALHEALPFHEIKLEKVRRRFLDRGADPRSAPLNLPAEIELFSPSLLTDDTAR